MLLSSKLSGALTGIVLGASILNSQALDLSAATLPPADPPGAEFAVKSGSYTIEMYQAPSIKIDVQGAFMRSSFESSGSTGEARIERQENHHGKNHEHSEKGALGKAWSFLMSEWQLHDRNGDYGEMSGIPRIVPTGILVGTFGGLLAWAFWPSKPEEKKDERGNK